ncbi:hypothetical protein V6C53_04000 [Desulfocurvibacter africanus]|uniref:hypothetical protein n=1 Tax=Desulfocurvibacter africanus TaxID=873 RepID=UPI002FD9961F
MPRLIPARAICQADYSSLQMKIGYREIISLAGESLLCGPGQMRVALCFTERLASRGTGFANDEPMDGIKPQAFFMRLSTGRRDRTLNAPPRVARFPRVLVAANKQTTQRLSSLAQLTNFSKQIF